MYYKKTSLSIVLVISLFLSADAQENEQGLSPEAREAITKIVTDPRYSKDNPDQYVNALPHLASLKQNLQSNNLIGNLNYIYGWSLPATGYFKVEQGNDLIFEIITRPKYNEKTFLSSLRIGDPLLRELRRYGCTDEFNTRFNADIPATGALSTAQAERFLYDIISKPTFNSETLISKLCDSKVSTSSETSVANNANSNSPGRGTLAPSTTGAQSGNTGLLAVIIIGGIIIVGLIVIVILRLLIELKKN